MSLGKRMTHRDYLRIAPLLSEVEGTKEALVTKLEELSEGSNSMSNIARSLLHHVFSPTTSNVTLGKHATKIFSLDRIVNSKTIHQPINSMNSQIVASLNAALINKAQIRHIEVNGNSTRVSKKAADRDFSYLLNDELESALLEGSTIKPRIAATVSVDSRIVTDPVISINLIGTWKPLNEITGEGQIATLADVLNMSVFHNKLKRSLRDTESNPAKADKILADVMKGIAKTVASNLTVNPYVERSFSKTVKSGKGKFLKVSPGKFLAEFEEVLEEVLQPDTTKQITVAGSKAASSSPPNRNAFLGTQIKTYDSANENVAIVKSTFNPFIRSGLSPKIPGAEFIGEVIKSPVMFNGKPIKLSAWSKKNRVEYALVQGMLKIPKSGGGIIGKDMALQVVAYSDKSQIPMHEVRLDYNAFTKGDATGNKVRDSFIAYHAEKNESLQRITIGKFAEFIGTNFNSIYTDITNSKGTPEQKAFRLERLAELRNSLISTVDGFKKGDMLKGDMLRSFNELLSDVAINPDYALYNDSTLDADVDYINMGNKLILKPTTGVRAAQYRTNGKSTMNSLINDNIKEIKKMNIDKDMLAKELKNSGVELSVDEFLKRSFLLNGTYGHGLKVLTMGDETYFKGNYNYDNISSYYDERDASPKSIMKEYEGMMKAQSKRAQSALTQGQRYAHKNTVEGARRKFAKDNILHHVHIQDGINYSFKSLQNKDLFELQALGVISAFPDGSIVGSEGEVLVNVGETRVTVQTKAKNHKDVTAVEGMVAITALMKNARIQAEKSVLYKGREEQYVVKLADPIVVRRRDRKRLTAVRIKAINKRLREDSTITVPDFMPSILVSDPVSNIDLLNAMGVNQENSDAIQMYHPLYYKLFQHARGGETSGFYNSKYTALKTVTTTFEYDSYRQSLQKKSGQVPFSMEQFIKLGGEEAVAMFTKMNRAMDFTTTKMNVPSVDPKTGRIAYDPMTGEMLMEDGVFNNMQDLFEHFRGWERTDESVWDDVVLALSNYGENMHNFVGIISVPSNQKTGHRKLNRWEDSFGTGDKGLVIDHMANEFNLEVLSKAHESDVSQDADHKSQLTLLSQLVNAVGFGGVSSVHADLLQRSMQAISEVEGIRIGKQFAQAAKSANLGAVATSLKEREALDDVVAAFEAGDYSGKQFDQSPEHQNMYREVILAGLHDVVENSFDSDLDSPMIKEILQDPEASLDTPAVREKVLGMLRSDFYKEAIKVKMSGFIGTVSAVHNVINIFTIPSTGKRVGRESFINYHLKTKKDLTQVTAENIEEIKSKVMPFDKIAVNGDIKKPIAAYDLDKLVAAGEDVKVSLIPQKNEALIADEYASLSELTKVTMIIGGRKSSMYKWRMDEILADKQLDPKELINQGLLKRDTTEDHSLRWYEIKDGDKDIKNTKQYKELYRLQVDNRFKKWKNSADLEAHQIKVESLTAAITLEIQRVDINGNKVWTMTMPEVVLPTFNAKAFGLPDGASVASVIGNDGHDLKNAIEYFSNMKYRKFQQEKPNRLIDKSIALARYTKKKALYLTTDTFSDIGYIDDIISLIKQSGDKVIANDINDILDRAKKEFATARANAFIGSLDVVLTRIPGQTKQSGFAATVVEFLDAQGNATHAPTEHLVNTGGDMDIDTLSVLTKTLGRDGVVRNYKQFVVDGVLSVAAVEESYKDDVGKVEQSIANSVEDFHDSLDARKALLPSLIEAFEEEKRNIIESNKNNIAYNEQEVERVLEMEYSLKYGEEKAKEGSKMREAADKREIVRQERIDRLLSQIENLKKVNSNSVESNTRLEGAIESKLSEIDELKGGIQDISPEIQLQIEQEIAKKKQYVDAAIQQASEKLANVEDKLNRTRQELITIEERRIPPEAVEKAVKRNIKEVHSNMMNMLANAMEAGVRMSLSNIDAAVEIQTPISLDIFASIKMGIKEMAVDSQGNKRHDPLENYKHSGYTINGENYFSHFIIEDLAAQGKEAIGVYATVLKMLSAVQVAKDVYDKGQKGNVNPFEFFNKLKYFSTQEDSNKNISKTTFADLERFDIMEDLAGNYRLQSTLKELREGSSITDRGALDELESIIINKVDATVKKISRITSLDPLAINSLAKTKIKELFGIDIDKEIHKDKKLAYSGEALADEFGNC